MLLHCVGVGTAGADVAVALNESTAPLLADAVAVFVPADDPSSQNALALPTSSVTVEEGEITPPPELTAQIIGAFLTGWPCQENFATTGDAKALEAVAV